MTAMSRGNATAGESAGGYALETAIELDFTSLLKDQSDDEEEVALDEMKATLV